MSDLGHSPETRKRLIELIDAIKSVRSPAKVRELGDLADVPTQVVNG
jgi:hypothetical protein